MLRVLTKFLCRFPNTVASKNASVSLDLLISMSQKIPLFCI